MSGERVVEIARTWIGTPYIHQASLIGVGCDCLGLLRGVWRELLGAEPCLLPIYSADWAEASGLETLAEAGREYLIEIPLVEFSSGDVILFRWRDNLPAKHCAIAVSKQHMIHAHDGATVAEVTIGPWWRRHIAYAFRFPADVSLI
jgi:NlpC/P60 family putative phage cell wall peptidase